jgi:hypothetical protein
MRVIKIDSVNRTISEIELNNEDENKLKGLQSIVEGLIEVAHELPNGDTLFVNEEGLMYSPMHFFEIKGAHQPFAGNGVIAGYDFESGDSTDAESSLSQVRSIVSFLSVDEVKRKYRH